MLGQLRAQPSRALPDAEEVIKYDMPGFQIENTIIAGNAAFSKQCGLYVDPGAIAAHADDSTIRSLVIDDGSTTRTPPTRSSIGSVSASRVGARDLDEARTVEQLPVPPVQPASQRPEAEAAAVLGT